MSSSRQSRPSLHALLAGVLLLTGPRARAQQQDTDPWFGRDKALHFTASASIAVVVYAGASFQTESRVKRVIAAASVALAAGVAKEAWDLSGHGDASWRDLTWDVIGTTTGVLLAYAIDWAVGRLRGPTEAAAPAR
jgi:putative lipoprotein